MSSVQPLSSILSESLEPPYDIAAMCIATCPISNSSGYLRNFPRSCRGYPFRVRDQITGLLLLDVRYALDDACMRQAEDLAPIITPYWMKHAWRLNYCCVKDFNIRIWRFRLIPVLLSMSLFYCLSKCSFAKYIKEVSYVHKSTAMQTMVLYPLGMYIADFRATFFFGCPQVLICALHFLHFHYKVK